MLIALIASCPGAVHPDEYSNVIGQIMIAGIGNDIVDIASVKKELGRDGEGLKNELFTPAEISYCESQRYPERHFAARFAAKEALFKALGTGKIGGMAWHDIEIRRDVMGKPSMTLTGATSETAAGLKIAKVFVSMSHTGESAAAYVILETMNNSIDRGTQ